MEYNIYIKLTNSCNLQCKHCFNEIMGNHNSMSNNTLNKTIDWLQKFKQNHLNDVINMSLHGGEPMLYNLDKILYLLNSTKNLKLKWCITTNLIYNLTEKHFEIFNKMQPFDNKPMIMTSYDFGDLRFQQENLRNLWKSNVKLIISKNIDIQPIICISDYVVKNIKPIEIFNLLQSLNIKKFNFERITETGRASINNIKPLNKDMDKWLLNAYKIYENTDLICPLFESINQSIKGIFLGCRARKCMERVITINPDGTIAGCPNIANMTYGNLDGINECKKCELIKLEQTKRNECLICQYYKYCNGDCFQLNWDTSGCSGLKSIYEYILKNN